MHQKSSDENKQILTTLLEEYISTMPHGRDYYLVKKENIVYNYVVKYNPTPKQLAEFLVILYNDNDETIPQILERNE